MHAFANSRTQVSVSRTNPTSLPPGLTRRATAKITALNCCNLHTNVRGLHCIAPLHFRPEDDLVRDNLLFIHAYLHVWTLLSQSSQSWLVRAFAGPSSKNCVPWTKYLDKIEILDYSSQITIYLQFYIPFIRGLICRSFVYANHGYDCSLVTSSDQCLVSFPGHMSLGTNLLKVAVTIWQFTPAKEYWRMAEAPATKK